MNTRRTLAGCAVALTLLMTQLVATANVVDLTFEGLQNLEPVENYYNGGYGGFGSGPGPNYGITFGSGSLAMISELAGGSGDFQNNPSGSTIAFFLTGPGDVMNVPAGFTTGFSFYYCAVNFPGSVTVYDGLNGTGNVLATLYLPVTPEIPGLPTDFNNWQAIGVSFSGTAESVDFSGTANQIGFDDITLGTQTPVPVPEPGTWIAGILAAGALGMGLLRQRFMA